ncbi:histidine kinase [Cavenderia fasciculata]|uniref:Histidine kinase n=1 Tax=Cavenderia fasciculata TaxID=261658 RepID=F4QCU1_CACFS|nr:histidine kinase [Cavenderia fasciculata]EGG14465.1 histidine kinase [Cavenderia fasciculata]|eukprot:XP_004353874.1 histidine kinase [Cavenderia fasciculata]
MNQTSTIHYLDDYDNRSNSPPSYNSSSSSSSSSSSMPSSMATSPIVQPTIEPCPFPNYCLICTKELPPCLVSRSVSWVSILRVVFYCLKQLYPEKEFFNLKKDVYGYVATHWDIICSKKKKTNGWRKQLQDALSHCRRLFVSGADRHDCYGYWKLKDYNDPWEDDLSANNILISNPSSPILSPLLSPEFHSNNNNNQNNHFILSPPIYGSANSNTSTPLLTSSFSSLMFSPTRSSVNGQSNSTNNTNNNGPLSGVPPSKSLFEINKLSMASPSARPRSRSFSFDNNTNINNNQIFDHKLKYIHQQLRNQGPQRNQNTGVNDLPNGNITPSFFSFRDQKVPSMMNHRISQPTSIDEFDFPPTFPHPLREDKPFQLNGSPPSSNNGSASTTPSSTTPPRILNLSTGSGNSSPNRYSPYHNNHHNNHNNNNNNSHPQPIPFSEHRINQSSSISSSKLSISNLINPINEEEEEEVEEDDDIQECSDDLLPNPLNIKRNNNNNIQNLISSPPTFFSLRN